MKARVTVTLRSGILDPQGKAIEGALKSLGVDGVASVRQGKVFDIELEGNDRARSEVIRNNRHAGTGAREDRTRGHSQPVERGKEQYGRQRVIEQDRAEWEERRAEGKGNRRQHCGHFFSASGFLGHAKEKHTAKRGYDPDAEDRGQPHVCAHGPPMIGTDA